MYDAQSSVAVSHVNHVVFSSRRRHTRYWRDWSSDVCSSDLADDVLRQGVQGISDLVTLPGLINLDFADVRTIMSNAGSALLGIGMGTGEGRAIQAAEQAASSPLLETSMEGARSILLSITGGRDPSLGEGHEGAPA